MDLKNIGVIIQARMGSTRLPGKVLKKLDDNDTILDVLIKRLKLSKKINKIIIATTPDRKNSEIIDLAKAHNVSYFVGSENNVLERYYEAAKNFNIDLIIRATSDNPFVDPKILDDIIVFYIDNNYDYVVNDHITTNFPLGLGFEIFSFNVLEKIYSLAETDFEREHITNIVFNNREKFSLYQYNLRNFKKIDDLRLTIDEKEDLIFCREVYKKLKEMGKSIDFTIYDIIEIIVVNPELMDINKDIRQIKKY